MLVVRPRREGRRAFATQHRSMYAWDGYGMGADSVDCDGRLRLAAEATTSRERACLSTRVFVAAPNLSRGWTQDAVACPPPLARNMGKTICPLSHPVRRSCPRGP